MDGQAREGEKAGRNLSQMQEERKELLEQGAEVYAST